MSDETDQSKITEEPTQENLGKGRERGQVTVSRAVDTRLMRLVGALGLAMAAPAMMGDIRLALIPAVDAPGVHDLAQRIRETIEAHDAKLIENSFLARALYAGVDLDDEVSPEHYQAVAEVTSYVWSLQGRAMPEERRRDE